jgi:cobalt-zinc-cadmium efflux system outer membrane protein
MVAQSRLAARLGLVQTNYHLFAVASPLPIVPPRQPEELVAEALAMRPDLRGAEFNLSAADKRADLAHWQFMRFFDVGYDANAEGEEGYEAGPALRMTLPLFNGNRGQRAITAAERERAARQIVTLRDQIALDVKASYAQASQAFDNLTSTRDELLPELSRTVELAQRNYVGGGSDYFLVLQTTSQYLDARSLELQQAANLRRAVAELERGVGHRVAPRILSPATQIPLPEQPVEPAVLGFEGSGLGDAAAAAVVQIEYHGQVNDRSPVLESRHSSLYDSIPELTQHPHATDSPSDPHRPGTVYLSDPSRPRLLGRQTGRVRQDQSSTRRGSSR